MCGLTHYGLVSATSASGRRYWVIELAGERSALARVRTPRIASPRRSAARPNHNGYRVHRALPAAAEDAF